MIHNIFVRSRCVKRISNWNKVELQHKFNIWYWVDVKCWWVWWWHLLGIRKWKVHIWPTKLYFVGWLVCESPLKRFYTLQLLYLAVLWLKHTIEMSRRRMYQICDRCFFYITVNNFIQIINETIQKIIIFLFR